MALLSILNALFYVPIQIQSQPAVTLPHVAKKLHLNTPQTTDDSQLVCPYLHVAAVCFRHVKRETRRPRTVKLTD